MNTSDTQSLLKQPKMSAQKHQITKYLELFIQLHRCPHDCDIHIEHVNFEKKACSKNVCIQNWKRLRFKMQYNIMYSMLNSTTGEAKHTAISIRSLVLVLLLKLKIFLIAQYV